MGAWPNRRRLVEKKVPSWRQKAGGLSTRFETPEGETALAKFFVPACRRVLRFNPGVRLCERICLGQ